MRVAAILLGLILALALAKAVLTLLGLALALAVACALIMRPMATLVLSGQVALFFVVMAYPWTAMLTLALAVAGLAIVKRSPDPPRRVGFRLPPPG